MNLTQIKATGRVAFETPAGVWAVFEAPVEIRGWWRGSRSVKIAVKRPAYGCLRCFVLLAEAPCPLCGGACEEVGGEEVLGGY
jgi:hypothetical protein